VKRFQETGLYALSLFMYFCNWNCTNRVTKGENMKFKVKFSVQFEVEVECEPKELYDCISDLYIPEDEQTKYVSDTFEVDDIEDDKGEKVKLFEEAD